MQEKTITTELPKEGLVQLNNFTTFTRTNKKTGEITRYRGVLPMSPSKFLRGVKDGLFPGPSKKFGRRCVCWDVADIRAMLNGSQTKREDANNEK